MKNTHEEIATVSNQKSFSLDTKRRFDILGDKSSENPKEDAYDFSKEFSKHGREEMAIQMRMLRRKYMKDIPAENVKRKEERTAIENKKEKEEQSFEQKKQLLLEIEAKRNDWLTAQEELKNIKEGIEKRKASLWYKVQRLFGGGHDVNQKEIAYYDKKREAGYFDDGELYRAQDELKSAEYSHEDVLKIYNRQIAQTEDVVIDEGWRNKAHAKIDEFYGKQNEIKNEWEKDQTDRGISENSKKHNVVFLHGIPFERQMGNTSMNNSLVDTEIMTSEDKAKFLVGLAPTISVSSKTLDSILAEKMPEHETMYETGFLVLDGKIMSAVADDAGTVAESIDIKRGKSGDSSVQTEISEHIADAVNNVDDRSRNAAAGYSWNEFVVQNPKTGPLYIMENLKNEEIVIPRMLKLANEMHVPLVRISRDGKIFNMTENRETTKEEIMTHAVNYTTQERINFIEQTKKFVREDTHPEMTEEIQKRLEALKAEKTEEEQKEEDRQKEKEIREKIQMTFK
jgi:hypothetical protein